MGDAEIRLALAEEFPALLAIDDDATLLYAEHGAPIELAPDHPFARAEQERWRRSTELGGTFVAIDESGEPVAFAALGWGDGAPYLDQLSVRRRAMRRGLGRRLLQHAAAWACEHGASELWLTTYGHLPFNRPYYERHGFVLVPEVSCGPEILHHLHQQRRYLPAPEHRVAMRRGV